MKICRTKRVLRLTLLELLLAVAIVVIIAGLLLPAISKSRSRARFARWLAFNRQCSNDPACVLNLNFQEGEGKVKNSAKGASFQGYDGSLHEGSFNGDTRWTEGRWPGMKKALLLPGYFSYMEVSSDPSGNFDSNDNYTIIMWLCMDYTNSYGAILTRGLYDYSPPNYFSQYYVYVQGSWSSDDMQQVSFRVQATGYGATFRKNAETNKEIERYRHDWGMFAMRHMIKNGRQVVDVFYNGIKMKRSNEKTFGKTRKIPSVTWLGGVKQQRSWAPDEPYHQQSAFGVKGRIDELVIYRRALTDKEIIGHYDMGRP